MGIIFKNKACQKLKTLDQESLKAIDILKNKLQKGSPQ